MSLEDGKGNGVLQQKFISPSAAEASVPRKALLSPAAKDDVATAATETVRKAASARAGHLQAEQRGTGQSRTIRTRRRHRRRRIAAYALLTLAAGFGTRWWQVNHAPLLLDLPKSTAAVAVSGPNASHFYAAAADSLTKDVLQGGDLTVGNVRNPVRSAAELQTLVAENATALQLLRRGFSYRYQSRATNWLHHSGEYHLSDPVPNFVTVRQMARLLQAEASVRAQEGDLAGAMRSCLDAVRFGQDMARSDSGLIGVMVGNLCLTIGLQDAPQYVAGLSGNDARAAARRLEGLLPTTPTVTDAITTERNFSHGALRDVLQANAAPSFLSSGGWYIPCLLWHGKQGMIDHIDTYLNAQMQLAALPYQQMRNQPSPPPPGDRFTQELVPNFERAALYLTTTQAKENVLLARLAVQGYRAEHGGIAPPTLDTLTQGDKHYLLRVPLDPFSPAGTMPLTYAKGRVFSVGPNGIAEQGQGDDF